MKLTDEQISKFQELYKEHFGVDIDITEALDKGLGLIRLTKIIAGHEIKEMTSQKELQT